MTSDPIPSAPPTEFNPLVSLFPDAFENLPTDIPAAQFIASIKGNQHKNLVSSIRQRFSTAVERGVPYDQAKAVVDKHKKKLPSVSFAGVLPMRRKGIAPRFTGLMQTDLDLLSDKLPEIRATLCADPHVFALFVSPSGEGLKAIYRVPICKSETEYKLAVSVVSKRVKELTGATIDKLEDFTRLCFASHDPDTHLNLHAVELPVDFTQPEPAATSEPPPSKKKSNAVKGGSEKPVCDPEIIAIRRSIAEDMLGEVEWDTEILGHCECPGVAEHSTGGKPNECRVMLDGAPTIFCVHNSCTEEITEANQRLRSEIGKAERPRHRNGSTTEYLPSEQEAVATVTDAPMDIAARLAQVRFNIKTPPPLENAVFTLKDGTITHTRGNISALTAQAKAGKTALIAALEAAAITSVPDNCDLLGFRAVNPEKLPVLLLDTEHSPAHHYNLCDRIFRRASLTESDLLHAYRLAGFTVKELNAALDHLLAELKWHSVILDGTGDFVADVNDPEECNEFVSRLHSLAIAHDTHIINVLHLNPSSDFKSRGDLGSQLERKAETNLRIEKKDGVSVVFADRNRGAGIPKATGPSFAWSESAHMHVLVDCSGAQAADLAKLREQMAEAFRNAGKPSLTWTELVKALQTVPGIKSKRSAERVHTDAKTHGIIKNALNRWELA